MSIRPQLKSKKTVSIRFLISGESSKHTALYLWQSRDGKQESTDNPSQIKWSERENFDQKRTFRDDLTYTEWTLLLSLGNEVKDSVHGLCCCCHKGPTQLGVLKSRTFLSANMQGFWPRAALSECWCQTSNPDTERHW